MLLIMRKNKKTKIKIGKCVHDCGYVFKKEFEGNYCDEVYVNSCGESWIDLKL